MSATALSSSAPAATRGRARARFALVGLGTVIASVLANVLFYHLAGLVVAYDPTFPPLASVGGTIFFTVVPAVVAVLLHALLVRFTRRPERIFLAISAVVFVVTLIPDLTYIPTVPGATVAQTTILVLMHVIAAGVIVGMLTTLGRARRR
jgi:apolipoprotein N-acyltransferase